MTRRYRSDMTPDMKKKPLTYKERLALRFSYGQQRQLKTELKDSFFKYEKDPKTRKEFQANNSARINNICATLYAAFDMDPTLYLWQPQIGFITGISEEAVSNAMSSVRRLLPEGGDILTNQPGIGYKIALPKEAALEAVKGANRMFSNEFNTLRSMSLAPLPTKSFAKLSDRAKGEYDICLRLLKEIEMHRRDYNKSRGHLETLFGFDDEFTGRAQEEASKPDFA